MIEKFFSNLITLGFGALTSLSTILRIFLVGSITFSLAAFYLPFFKSKWKRLKDVDNLPGPKCTSVIMGNIPYNMLWNSILNAKDYKSIIINLMSSISGYTQIYQKEKIFRVWLSWEPLVFVWNPETVEKILSNNFLLEKSAQYKFLHPWLGTGLLTSEGSKWRTRRKLLVPAFHFKILHDFVPVFNEQAKILVHRLRSIARRKCNNCTVIDIVPVITACTLDIICETIMGVSIGAQQSSNNRYCKSVNEVGECFLERLMQPQLWPDLVFYRSQSGSSFSNNLIRLHSFTRKVIRDRKAEILNSRTTIRFRPNDNDDAVHELEYSQNDRRKAFLDLLLDQHIKSDGKTMSEEDIREEVDTFMFEGHDTTAMALSWILFMLGHHPEIQAKAAAEIDAFFDEIDKENPSNPSNNELKKERLKFNDHEDDIHLGLDEIKSLKFLECCIKEGLRLFPSVPFIGRRLHEDIILNNRNVPKGTIIFVYIYMLHRDPNVFPDPERFDPDRFSQENSIGRHPFAFVPFSAGPRNCIGQRFAMSELKVVLAHLLRNFRFESLDQRDKISAMMEMVYRPKSPLRLRVYERRKSELLDNVTMELMVTEKRSNKSRMLNNGSAESSSHSSLGDAGIGSDRTSVQSSNHFDHNDNHSILDLRDSEGDY
ncbi:Cytochrome P450 4c3 [Sarcoptes scabiei]|uniref:Cytochrome P450 4c3 n=1 Tax=Sarcoptes scabiei TaxID=52283 RepID=A0A834VFX8_SARSC|nr:Cytochrome P450 4c3 [Sarcoptes scabiei]